MKQPNILFAIADDATHFSAYGHSFVNTPAFDRVARSGVLFNGMFTTNPKCSPSRASVLTGYHTWQLKEAGTHWCIFPGADRLDVYPDLMERAGYHTGYTGKGWGPGDWERNGRAHNPAGHPWNDRELTPPEGSAIRSIDYAANFTDFLDARSGEAPFCFWYGGHEPHREYIPGEGEAHGKRLEEIDTVPPFWPEEDVVKSDILDYAYEIEWFDRQLGIMLQTLEERGELENTLVIVTSDNGCPFPRVKGQMYDLDFRMPFAAMWSGRIPAGRVVDDLASFIDLTPTFLELAGAEIPESLPGKSLTDILFSTQSGQVNPDRVRTFMGKERHDLGRKDDAGYPVRCVRTPDYLYVRNYEPDRWPSGDPVTGFTEVDSSPTKSRVIELHEQGNDFYYDHCFGKRPAEELFHIPSDEHCMKDLAQDEAYSEILSTLRDELVETLKATGDPRISGNGDIFDTYEYLGQETEPHSWRARREGRWEPQRY